MLVPAGCSFEASLTGSATVLYYTIGSTGVGTGCTAFTDTLYQINPTSGATTTGVQVTIGGSGVNAFVGSTFVGGKLYGFIAGGQEYTIDPGTGVATSVANTTPTTAIIGAGSSQ
jgi:glutamine cyclotransferase